MFFFVHWMWFNVNYFKNPSCMTKYFGKWIKIKIYIFCHPSHGNIKNNAILGHVDFFWIFLDIIDKNIFNYLISKFWKKKFIKINLRARISTSMFESYSKHQFYFICMDSKPLAVCLPFFRIFFSKFFFFPQMFFWPLSRNSH
jgi:hypothetical protein